jgi:hypothetical protein
MFMITDETKQNKALFVSAFQLAFPAEKLKQTAKRKCVFWNKQLAQKLQYK